MKNLRIFLILLFYILLGCTAKEENVEINAIVYSLNGGGETFSYYVNEFNKYAKKNNLSVTANLNLITPQNSSFALDMHTSGMMLEELMKKKNKKYDFFFYDNSFKDLYAPYLIDLTEYLEEDHINMYDKNILSLVCYSDNRLVGLPATIDYEGLFSNRALLQKYNKTQPKTWDELVETSKYILEKEEEEGITDLIGYNGYFTSPEDDLFSFMTFLFSCRDTFDSPLPELNSETTIKALELLKYVKNEASSDDVFTNNILYTIGKLYDGKAVFVKFYFMYEYIKEGSPYILSNLPGIKDGISGTLLTGYNIGIANYISSEKIKYSVEAIKFMTSLEIQRELVLGEQIISGILSLYREEDVCSRIGYCEFYRDAQPVAKPYIVTNDLQTSVSLFSKYLRDYLFGDEIPENTIRKMEDINKIYDISIDPKESSVGLVIFIIILLILIIIILSSSLLFINRFEKEFNILPKPFWLLILLGIIMLLTTTFIKYGAASIYKCHLNTILLSLGYTLTFTPVLYFLIISFPNDDNRYSIWVKSNKYLFFMFFTLFDILFNGLSLITPYTIKTINYLVENDKNYNICDKNSTLLKTSIYLFISYKVILIFVMILLIFLEWNLIKVKYDIRLILSNLYLNIITFAILFIFESFFISNYILHFLIQVLLIILLVIVNYLLLYFSRLFIPLIFKEDEDSKLFEHFSLTTTAPTEVAESQNNNPSISQSNKSNNTNNKSNHSDNFKIFSSLMEYHYRTLSESESRLQNSNNFDSNMKSNDIRSCEIKSNNERLSNLVINN